MLAWKEAKCAKCGKIFIPAPQHALVAGKKMYCSCTCYLHRKGEEKTDGRKKQAYRVLQYTLDGKYIKTYESARFVGDLFGVCANNVAEACRSGRAWHGFIWKYAKDVEKEC